MLVGIYDAEKEHLRRKTFPNLALMKISAYHKSKGDEVEFVIPLFKYDRIYISKVLGDEYSNIDNVCLQADEIISGGTGFAISVENGKEVYKKSADGSLPPEVEHIYPDYTLYPELTKNTAYGFLTRGCPNNCGFCVVSKKEGRKAVKTADLSEFWRGQKHIKLLDANLLACEQRKELLQQLIESGASVDFTQGIDARFITDDIAKMLVEVKTERIHFSFDFMKNEKAVLSGLEIYKKYSKIADIKTTVYILTNYDTSIQEDIYRIKKVEELGYIPDVRIYRKPSAPQILKDLQRWCNNRILYHSCEFMDYVPRRNGKTIKQTYFEKEDKENV